jgi:methanogenic corrinoid protein MtbC1
MGKCHEVITSLKEMNLRHKLKVIVGGAPITKDFAKRIGSDSYAVDGSAAVQMVDSLMQNKYFVKKHTKCK